MITAPATAAVAFKLFASARDRIAFTPQLHGLAAPPIGFGGASKQSERLKGRLLHHWAMAEGGSKPAAASQGGTGGQQIDAFTARQIFQEGRISCLEAWDQYALLGLSGGAGWVLGGHKQC